MEVLKGVEILAGDAAVLGKQGGEFVRPGAEGLRLFQQYGMMGEGLLESPSEGYGVARGASPFAEIVVSRQNLPTAIYERSHRLSMTPAEGGARRTSRAMRASVLSFAAAPHLVGLVRGFAGGSTSVLPDTLPAVLPYAIGHVVERRLFRLRRRPALRQIRSDLGVRHRRLPGRCPPACRRCRRRAAPG